MMLRCGRRAADRVIGGVLLDPNAPTVVADGDRAGRVGADFVAGDQIVVRSRAGDRDPFVPVTRDHVSGVLVVPPMVLSAAKVIETPK